MSLLVLWMIQSTSFAAAQRSFDFQCRLEQRSYQAVASVRDVAGVDLAMKTLPLMEIGLVLSSLLPGIMMGLSFGQEFRVPGQVLHLPLLSDHLA